MNLKTPLWLSILVSAVYASSTFAHHSAITNEGRLIDSVSKPYDTYAIMDDEMLYQKKKSETYTAGYRPSSSYVIKGAITKKVYDFPEKYSSVGVFERVKTAMIDQGFSVLYECMGLECGDLLGWKLYLSNWIGGVPDTQYYSVYRKLNTSNEQIEHKVVHVAELDKMPRLIIQSVKRVSASNRYDEFTAKRILVDKNLEKIYDFYFDTASPTSSDYDASDVEKLVQKIQSLPKEKQVLLVGYTDNVGNAARNKTLSRKRAKSIQTLLSQQFNIEKNLMIVRAVGELDTPKEERDKARKVSVFIVN